MIHTLKIKYLIAHSKQIVCLEDQIASEREKMSEAQKSAIEQLQQEHNAVAAATVAEAEKAHAVETAALKAELEAGFEAKLSSLTNELDTERNHTLQLTQKLLEMEQLKEQREVTVR